jgi:hypothetical protein
MPDSNLIAQARPGEVIAEKRPSGAWSLFLVVAKGPGLTAVELKVMGSDAASADRLSKVAWGSSSRSEAERRLADEGF